MSYQRGGGDGYHRRDYYQDRGREEDYRRRDRYNNYEREEGGEREHHRSRDDHRRGGDGYPRGDDYSGRRGDHRRDDYPRRDDYSRRDDHRGGRDDYRGRDGYSRRDDRYSYRDRDNSQERKLQQEMRVEKKEHDIRLAIRNNTISYDMSINEMFMELPQAKKAELVEQAQSPQHIHECVLVRELYVSGLFDLGEPAIKQFFSKYGEIEDVEIIKNFVFVKYFKVEDASNACADYHNINTTLHQSHNTNFKIFFADHLKRFNVVSNNSLYQVKEHLIPVLYASVRNDPQYTNEQYLQPIFSKFGFIRNMEIKRNELPTQRTYVLVEYETLEQALRARERLRNMKDKLGDRKSEITVLIDNDKITRMFPNINNQLRYQRKRQQNTASTSINQQQQQPMSGGMGAGGMGMSNMQPMGMPQGMGNPPPPQRYEDYGGYGAPPPTMGGNAVGTGGGIEHNQEDIGSVMEWIQGQIGEKRDEDERYESDWCGFFTRNRQFKVQVDFHKIHKEEPCELQTVLNVAYRADNQQGLTKNYDLAGKFKAANQSNVNAFQEYISYFTKKSKAGVIVTSKFLIYLVPPDLPDLPYKVGSNELLALFFKVS